MRIELGKPDFELIEHAFSLLWGLRETELSSEAQELRLELIRERFQRAFTAWLDMDGEG